MLLFFRLLVCTIYHRLIHLWLRHKPQVNALLHPCWVEVTWTGMSELPIAPEQQLTSYAETSMRSSGIRHFCQLYILTLRTMSLLLLGCWRGRVLSKMYATLLLNTSTQTSWCISFLLVILVIADELNQGLLSDRHLTIAGKHAPKHSANVSDVGYCLAENSLDQSNVGAPVFSSSILRAEIVTERNERSTMHDSGTPLQPSSGLPKERNSC